MAANQHCKTRQVKIYGKHRPNNTASYNVQEKVVPWLNISGVWLERTGFKVGATVIITLRENELTIRPL